MMWESVLEISATCRTHTLLSNLKNAKKGKAYLLFRLWHAIRTCTQLRNSVFQDDSIWNIDVYVGDLKTASANFGPRRISSLRSIISSYFRVIHHMLWTDRRLKFEQLTELLLKNRMFSLKVRWQISYCNT